MKWISIFAIMLFIFSCKKEKTNNTSLVGKWKTIEIYQGYVMGGCFCWKLVESQDAPILEFSVLGRYTLTQPPHFSVSGCSGNYRVVNDSTLSMTYECQSDPTLEVNRPFTKDGNILIIDYQGFEGVIRYKYMKF